MKALNNFINFIKELYVRWTLEAPSFFKNLSKLGWSIVGIGGILVAAKTQAPDTISPAILDMLHQIGTHAAFAGGLIVAIASSAVKDPEELDKKLNKTKTN